MNCDAFIDIYVLEGSSIYIYINSEISSNATQLHDLGYVLDISKSHLLICEMGIIIVPTSQSYYEY